MLLPNLLIVYSNLLFFYYSSFWRNDVCHFERGNKSSRHTIFPAWLKLPLVISLPFLRTFVYNVCRWSRKQSSLLHKNKKEFPFMKCIHIKYNMLQTKFYSEFLIPIFFQTFPSFLNTIKIFCFKERKSMEGY